MKVRQLDTDRRADVRAFIRFPFQLYHDCPQWVPPLISAAAKNLNRHKHPFYRRAQAQFFLAQSEGQTLGRLAVMDDHDYNDRMGAASVFFGFFDVAQDLEVARGLFQAAFDWARRRHLTEILGPRELGAATSSGVLVEGLEHRPALTMNYNYDYYDGFIKDAGFAKAADHLSGYLSGDHKLPERYFRIADKVQARRDLWVKTFQSKDEMRQWVPRVGQVFREAFSEDPGFHPPSDEDIAQFAQNLISIAEPGLIKLVMKEEVVVGYLFAYPDISAGLQKARGRLWPLGWVHILRERRRTKWVNLNGLGVLPAYQGSGASILLYAELARSMEKFDFEHAEVVKVGEENLKSRSDMEAIGVKWYKRHRSYRRLL